MVLFVIGLGICRNGWCWEDLSYNDKLAAFNPIFLWDANRALKFCKVAIDDVYGDNVVRQAINSELAKQQMHWQERIELGEGSRVKTFFLNSKTMRQQQEHLKRNLPPAERLRVERNYIPYPNYDQEWKAVVLAHNCHKHIDDARPSTQQRTDDEEIMRSLNDSVAFRWYLFIANMEISEIPRVMARLGRRLLVKLGISCSVYGS